MLLVRKLGLTPYMPVWEAMRQFTDARGPDTPDELWLLEHEPVYTQGLAGRPEHVLTPGDIPVIQTDRGGQVTYHGPGQLVAYPLVDLNRAGIGIRTLVHRIEEAVIRFLDGHGVAAETRDGAPGVYVAGAKIASIGMKVRRARTYHGLAFNIDMDLEPFARINPCGFAGLNMTQLSDYLPGASVDAAGNGVARHLRDLLGYVRLDFPDAESPQASETVLNE